MKARVPRQPALHFGVLMGGVVIADQVKVGGAWPTSELHAVAVSGARNVALVSRTTTPVWAAVTWGTTFLERLRRSALSQFDGHDCDAITGLSARIPG
jgi:hypothetical protein